MLLRKPKISYRYLKSGIQEFYGKYVLVPADKVANNYINILKQELSGCKASEQSSVKEKYVINNHIFIPCRRWRDIGFFMSVHSSFRPSVPPSVLLSVRPPVRPSVRSLY